MFDRTTIHQAPDTIVHHEHRAPTDDSIRLMQEMEEKVLRRMVGSHSLDSNMLTATAIVLKRSEWDQRCDVVGQFTLNGHVHNFRYQTPERWATDEYQFYQEVVDRMRNAITEKMLGKHAAEFQLRERP